ncbi:hypothetical protein CDD81_1075 [Ophiocordyceps australis]|uniref:PD-(D/E)XK nuclease-like domain-containing protein n=1 Tax=Ophiocordyceps australis TaxID=1399860 RepID=A0A2C5Y0G1_9HYPO|nr:hypothetical protein CDD81_1075 [Ophiocordyceps australis]
MRHHLSEHPDKRLSSIAQDDFCFNPSRDQIGHTPPSNTIVDVLDSAMECAENFHAEASWNIEVHSRILSLALRPSGQPQFANLINFTSCSTASIIGDYLPCDFGAKKVDFCMYLNPIYDEPILPAYPTSLAHSKMEHAIGTVKDYLPESVINYTDYPALRERPIILNIETKRRFG